MIHTDNLTTVNEELVMQYLATRKSSRQKLFDQFEKKLVVNPILDRSLISFQANKREPYYRWFKYKEGFSTRFVEFILEKYGKSDCDQTVLDPFSGIGTTLTTSLQKGFNAIGIELLAPGILATKARISAQYFDFNAFKNVIKHVESLDYEDKNVHKQYFFKHVAITQCAFSDETETAIACFNRFMATSFSDRNVQILLTFALNAILEDVSFTRKDGQYLRWDHRSGRSLKSSFDKGIIFKFKERMLIQLNMMLDDLSQYKAPPTTSNLSLINGSCLDELMKMNANSVDLVITSPPYCNRYDYTRTYALELAFNGADNQMIKNLRQKLLSATVENKSKYQEIRYSYLSINKLNDFERITELYDSQEALNEVVNNLNYQKNRLNNKNIPQMVQNYFFEMNFVIHELSRVLKPNGKIVMVNDNVQYGGEEVPVDLILSDFAKSASLNTDVIWVLEKGKGNSSQQMGEHGRQEMRKCIYVWSKA